MDCQLERENRKRPIAANQDCMSAANYDQGPVTSHDGIAVEH
jgi:hypothetical protein